MVVSYHVANAIGVWINEWDVFSMESVKTRYCCKRKKQIIKCRYVDRNHVYKNHSVIKGARTLFVRKLTFKNIFLYFPTVLVKHIPKPTLKK